MRPRNPVWQQLHERHVRLVCGREIQRAKVELAKLPERRAQWDAAGSDPGFWDATEARQRTRKTDAERRVLSVHVGAAMAPERVRRMPAARPAAHRPRRRRSATSRAGPSDDPGEPEPPRTGRLTTKAAT